MYIFLQTIESLKQMNAKRVKTLVTASISPSTPNMYCVILVVLVGQVFDS